MSRKNLLTYNFFIIALIQAYSISNLVYAKNQEAIESLPLKNDHIQNTTKKISIDSIDTNNKTNNDDNDNINDNIDDDIEQEDIVQRKVIRSITFSGSTHVSNRALLSRIPYRVGEEFNPIYTGQAIRNLYSLKYFDDIQFQVEDLSETEVALHIIVHEKKKIEGFSLEGAKNLKKEEIEKKVKLEDIPAASEEEIELYAQQIKKLYAEKNYHDVAIKTELRPTTNNNVTAVFVIDEGLKSTVRSVNFIGNKTFHRKILSKLVFTRPDWPLGFMDKAGTYQPEALEYDKHILEMFYQSNGFLMARASYTTAQDAKSGCIDVIFTIDEGDIFTIRSVSAPGNELLSEADLLARIAIKPGQLYSKELIGKTLEALRIMWGQFGYIYAEIEPSVQPNFDTKTVDLTFYSELGNKIFLNRINVIGNTKTRDHVIRRYLTLTEGQLLLTPQMDFSKIRVESLGFFDPQTGVNWKINKVAEGLADLDLIVNEIKTGKLYAQIGYGGADPQSPSTSLRVGAGISDRNFFGTGIRYNLNLTYARDDRGIIFNIYQPWLFDRPIGAGLDIYHRKSTYEDFRNVQDIPVETVTGISSQLAFAPQTYPDLATLITAGLERICYANPVRINSAGKTVDEQLRFQTLIDRRFQPGEFSWVALNIGQDARNHPVFPSRGYNWAFSTKAGIPAFNSNFGFIKVDFDGTWLTPLIGEYDLVFLLHGHLGYVKPFSDRAVPYRELYHIGGPATVRGFTFGQIGPQLFCDSIGAQKAFWINAELIFSITKDQSMRAVLFYDGGSGWDTPNINTLGDLRVQNNLFNYRHAIGFGIRLINPTPLRIDWGFKLDRNKRRGEKFGEIHFSMAQEF